MKPALLFGLGFGWVSALVLPMTAVAAPFAYVVNQPSDNVSVIDTATDTVVGSPIAVGDEPAGVAITPDGTKAYVANYQSRSVSVIATSTNTVVSTLDLGERPFGVAITPDGTKAYVIGTDDGTPGAPVGTNHIFVIDTATDAVTGPFPSGGNPSPPITGDSLFIAITPDGSKAYVTNRFSQMVLIIDTATNLVAGPAIPIAGVPVSLAITPDGAKVYVGNDRGILPSEDGPGVVWVIDTVTNTVSETITTAAAGDAFSLAKRVPGVAITPNGSKAWVTLHEAGKIGAITVATDQLTTTLGPIDPSLQCVDNNRAGCANGIAITPDGSKAYVTMGGSSTKVAAFDLTANMLTGTITVGSSPSGIAITPLPDADGDGSPTDQDCDDTNADIHPGAPEICNGIDDDCDDTVDEGFDVGVSCTVGIGACQRTGIKVCTADHSTTECNVTPGTPSPEICNGIDDDCDGLVDESPTNPLQPLSLSCYSGPGGTAGIGVCHAGTRTCTNGSFGACVGEVTPATEVCGDGIDQDCNGQDSPCCPGRALSIDIAPGNSLNRINPKSQGRVSVALLTTPGFDALSVLPATVRLGRMCTVAAPLGAPPVACTPKDVPKKDGDIDLICHFRVAETGMQCGDTKACVTGTTVSGEQVWGCDFLITIRCP